MDSDGSSTVGFWIFNKEEQDLVSFTYRTYADDLTSVY
jgi:hypothetical protein